MAKINKQRFVTGNSLGGLELEVGLSFHSTIDYDRKLMRKALRVGGREVIQEARRLLSRAGVSTPGGVPGEVTGRLRRSIKVISTGSKGGWIKVGPATIKGSVFYPAFLFYGSLKTGLEKRANYMEMALQNRRESVRNMIRESLRYALVPR